MDLSVQVSRGIVNAVSFPKLVSGNKGVIIRATTVAGNKGLISLVSIGTVASIPALTVSAWSLER